IWALWHFPLIIFADYNGGTPTWYSCLCFFVMVVALGVIFAWLRLRSGSVWPAAILHASHNLFVQAFFDRVTVDTGPTRWLTSEFGAALALELAREPARDRKSTRLNSSHGSISYAVFCLQKK